MKEYTNHSGGCPGSDMTWENIGNEYGFKTIAYSFRNHHHESKNPKILTHEELQEGFEHVRIASVGLKRKIPQIYPYVKNLLSRNWYQVKNSAAIYAIGTFQSKTYKLVNGGTGWAVQMAIDNYKPIYFFDQDSNQWFTYNYGFIVQKFEPFDSIPVLTSNFAGIGTREITLAGKNAIRQVIEYNVKEC